MVMPRGLPRGWPALRWLKAGMQGRQLPPRGVQPWPLQGVSNMAVQPHGGCGSSQKRPYATKPTWREYTFSGDTTLKQNRIDSSSALGLIVLHSRLTVFWGVFWLSTRSCSGMGAEVELCFQTRHLGS